MKRRHLITAFLLLVSLSVSAMSTLDSLLRVLEKEIEQASVYTERKQDFSRMQASHAQAASALADRPQAPGAPANAPAPQPRRPIVAQPHIGRNDPCPCGSGLKYKNCHGKGI